MCFNLVLFIEMALLNLLGMSNFEKILIFILDLKPLGISNFGKIKICMLDLKPFYHPTKLTYLCHQ